MSTTDGSPVLPNTDVTDEDLVDRAKDQDRDAFSQLVLRYQDRIVNVVASRVRNRETAYDIAQDVFVKAWRGIGGFKREAGFYTWLYRIAINTTLSHRRKQLRRGSMLSLDRPTADAEQSLHEAVPDEGPGPETEAVRREEVIAVREAIRELDDDFNEVLVLRDLEGLAYEEIAEILQCPVGSVKSRIHRARKKLLVILEGRIQS